MNDRYDVIIIGGGHNGLTAACLVAMTGASVLLVEKRDSLGGLAAAVEFEPGFRSAGVWHGTGNVSAPVLHSLGLKGLVHDAAPVLYALAASGRLVPVTGPTDSVAFGIAQENPSDGRQYARYRAFMKRIRPVMSRFLTHRPVNWLEVEKESAIEILAQALGLRLLGSRDMIELLRVAPMPVADFLDEYFESGYLKGALAMDAVLGTFTAPRSPGTTMNLLMHESMAGASIRGGATVLTDALARRAEELGVRAVCGSAVAEILVEDRSVAGVRLEDGSVVEARAVGASCDPKSVLLDLLPVDALTHTTGQRIANYRSHGTAASLLLAVDGPVSFAGATAEQNVSRVRVAPTPVDVEKAFDAIKYGRYSDEPVLDIEVPTVHEPALSPPGKSVVSVLASYAPYELEGGWTDAAKDILTGKIIATISRLVPGFERRVVAAKLSTPVDLEDDYGLAGGHLHHGEPALDQVLVRPIPECFSYRTPVPGLSLCGSGTHPGGIVSCVPGALAAREITRAAKAAVEAA